MFYKLASWEYILIPLNGGVDFVWDFLNLLKATFNRIISTATSKRQPYPCSRGHAFGVSSAHNRPAANLNLQTKWCYCFCRSRVLRVSWRRQSNNPYVRVCHCEHLGRFKLMRISSKHSIAFKVAFRDKILKILFKIC